MSTLSRLAAALLMLRATRGRGGSHTVDGSGASPGGRVCRIVLMVCALAAVVVGLGASSAVALTTHSFAFSFGSQGSGAGQLSSPQSVAVNDATGDVYVADTGNSRVDEFDSAGNFIRAWGWGVADGASSFETCTTTCQAGISGSGAGQFETPTFIAVDNSGGPSQGDVYVADTAGGTGGRFVAKFDANGNVISSWESNGQLPGSDLGEGNFPFMGIAVDPTGDLWLYNGFGFEYSQDGAGITSWYTGPTAPSGIAVDSAGHIYVGAGGVSPLLEYTASGSAVGEVTDDQNPGPIVGVAVDPATNDVYADDGGGLIRHYYASSLAACVPNDNCKAADTFGSGNLSGSAADLAVNGANGEIYVADPGGNDVSAFALPAPSAPSVDSLIPANVTPGAADLTASIDPNQLDTSYRFEWGTTTAYGTDVPVPDADIGSGSDDVAVSVHLTGLQPDTLYHFTVVAHNSAGTTTSPDKTFMYQEPPVSSGCTNTALRTGDQALLPDCRAYELVTPPGVEPYLIAHTPQNQTGGTSFTDAEMYGPAASEAGDRVGFVTLTPPADSPTSGPYFLAIRGSSGWSSQDLIPPQSTTEGDSCLNSLIPAYSSDLTSWVLSDGSGSTEVGPCGGTDDPVLVPGEPQGAGNLFLAGETGSYQLIDVTPAGVIPADAHLQDASTDFSHMFFDENAQLTPDAPAGDDLYEWTAGTVRLVTVLPDGTPAQGSLVDAVVQYPDPTLGSPTYVHAVSDDGSRAFFTANGNLYVREHPDQPQSPISGGACTVAADACTVQVDASQAGGSGGGGAFMWASSDGSQVAFTDDASAGLTSDTVPGSGQNLYSYDVSSGALTDLTPAADANVLGVSGESADGSYVYFAADGPLAGGASAGEPNLYLAHAGTLTFIASLSSGAADATNWQNAYLTARVSASGQFLAFNSVNSLTSYDNTDASTGVADQEIYLYDAAGHQLSCVSCDPSGAPPTDPASLNPPAHPYFGLGIDASPPSYLQGNLSNDGRVFFDTGNELLPRDSNGLVNVYEWEPDGVGSCGQPSGCLDLISPGTGSEPAYFYDASPSGTDVFFAIAQQLVAQDSGNGYSIFDARVNGGFPSSPAPQACAGDPCQGPLTGTPAPPTPATVGFSGPGDSPGPATSSKVKVRILRTLIHGSRFVVAVTVQRAGRITISGRYVDVVERSASRAGTWRLTVALTGRMGRRLAHRHRLKVALHVRYEPAQGARVTATLDLTLSERSRRS